MDIDRERGALLLEAGEALLRASLDASGGTLSEEEVAAMLGIPLSALDSLGASHSLIRLWHGGHVVYPAFQFAGGSVLPDIPAVLAHLRGCPDVAIVRFFLQTNPALAESPMSALREHRNLDLVMLAARQFGEQGPR
jgi:hypothetical protein